MVRTSLEYCPTARVSDALATETHKQFIYIYILYNIIHVLNTILYNDQNIDTPSII